MEIIAALWVGVAAFIAAVLAYAVYRLIIVPHRLVSFARQQGIEFPPYRPILGNIPEVMAEIRSNMGTSSSSSSNRKRGGGSSYPARHMTPTHPGFLVFDQQRARLEGTERWKQPLGRVLGAVMFIEPTVMLLEPELVRQVLVTHSSCYAKPLIGRLSLAFLGNGLVLSSGPFWARQRRMINPAFSMAALRDFIPLMDQQVRCTVRRWRRKVEEAAKATDATAGATAGVTAGSGNGAGPLVHVVAGSATGSGSAGGTGVGTGVELELEMQDALSLVALDVIGVTAFGSHVPGTSMEAARDIYQTVARLGEKTISRMLSGRAMIPLYSLLPTPENRTIASLTSQLQSHALKLISHRREASTKGEFGKDLLSFLLAARDDVSNEQMTDQQLVDECLTFLIAGHSTTAKLAMWSVYLLALFPEWQQRLREEVRSVMGGREKAGRGREGGLSEGVGGHHAVQNGSSTSGTEDAVEESFSFEELQQLKQMGMVLNETLRIYPPVLGVGRSCIKDNRVGPYVIRKGMGVHIPISALHSDKAIWGDDAHEFKPGRFANGVQEAASQPWAFLPFSVGPRDCIGGTFAVLEVKLILCHMLQNLSWRISPTYKHYPIGFIGTRAKYGMQVLFEAL